MLQQALKRISNFIPPHKNFPLNYIVPVYHVVSDGDLPHMKHIVRYKNTRDFEKDMDYMLEKFDFVDWDFFKNNYNTKAKKPCALLTFDDGLIEFKDVVMPILLRKGIYAVNFINPAFVGNSDMMFRMKASLLIDKINDRNYVIPKSAANLLGLKGNSKIEASSKIRAINYNNRNLLTQLSDLMDVDFQEYTKQHKIYMDINDLLAVEKQGFGIAAHSWDHPYFFDLPIDDQLENAQKSIDFVREHGFLADTFAFPFSDVGVKKEFFEKLFERNKNMSLTFGTSGIKEDSFSRNIHRVAMENGNSAEDELNFGSKYYRIKALFNKNMIARG